MRVLIVGGAGYLGTTIVPALEREHECRHYDLRPVPGAEDRTIVADVNDDEQVGRAVEGQESIIYLAMGWAPVGRSVQHTTAAFTVNLMGAYRFLFAGLKAGARSFIYASTLSVYEKLNPKRHFDETVPADAFTPYGLTKRLAEHACQAGAQAYPEATIIALRLISPRNETDWANDTPGGYHRSYGLGPNDLRRLFSSALRCRRPGAHVVQATGDVEGVWVPNGPIRDLLDWQPRGE